MSAELVDPFTTHESSLTPEEWVAIRDEVSEAPWLDPARFPELVTYAMEALRDIACGVGNPYMPSHAATQALRRMAYRASTGGWTGEREAEPADSLDSSTRESLIEVDHV